MSKKSIIASIVFTLFYSVSSIFAGTIFIPPGARANSMAGAFVAVADDATAIYWNPAGLTNLEGTGIEGSIFYIGAEAKGSRSLLNVDNPINADELMLGKIYPTEPGVYQSKVFETKAVFPFIAGYTKVNDIVVAVGCYVVGGGGGKWEDAVKAGADDLKALVDASYGFVVGNISGAKKIGSNLSIGVGLNFIYMQDNAEIEKAYFATTGSPFYSYDLKMERKGTGSGIELIGGALYSPLDKLQLALTLRSGAALKINGKAEYNQEGLAPLGFPDVFHETDYSQNYEYPLTCGIGAAYKMTELLTLAIGVNIENYSMMKEDINYDRNDTVFRDVNKKLDWKNIAVISFGADYRLNEKLSFQGGIQRNPAPYPQDQLTLLGTDQYTLTYFTLGTEYKVNSWKINVNYVHSFSDEPEQSGVKYEYPSDSFRVGIGYGF